GALHKVFQLPSAASLDDIVGRFEAGVLTLTMPKRAGVDDNVKTGDAGGEEIRTKPKEEQQKPKKEKELKPKSPQAAATPTQTPEKQSLNPTSSDKAMAVVYRECLAERARRRGKEERA
ncbi:hypothetical protein ZWY2020_014090, partial [Hordeum vulgare]